jgi:hypothetical protein
MRRARAWGHRVSAWGPHERAGVGTVRASAVRAVRAHPAGVHGPGGCMRVCVRGDPAGTHTGRRGDPVGTHTGVRGDPAGTGVRGSSRHGRAGIQRAQTGVRGDPAGTDTGVR